MKLLLISMVLDVLEQLGFSIKTANIVHINSSYVRGDTLEVFLYYYLKDLQIIIFIYF